MEKDNMTCKEDKSFVFYESFRKMIEDFPKLEDKYRAAMMILDYGLYGDLPQEIPFPFNLVMDSVVPLIKKAKKRRTQSQANGKNGGAPHGNQNAKKKVKLEDGTTQNQPKTTEKQPKTTENNRKTTEKQPKNNLNVNDNVNVNDEDNVFLKKTSSDKSESVENLSLQLSDTVFYKNEVLNEKFRVFIDSDHKNDNLKKQKINSTMELLSDYKNDQDRITALNLAISGGYPTILAANRFYSEANKKDNATFAELCEIGGGKESNDNCFYIEDYDVN